MPPRLIRSRNRPARLDRSGAAAGAGGSIGSSRRSAISSRSLAPGVDQSGRTATGPRLGVQTGGVGGPPWASRTGGGDRRRESGRRTRPCRCPAAMARRPRPSPDPRSAHRTARPDGGRRAVGSRAGVSCAGGYHHTCRSASSSSSSPCAPSSGSPTGKGSRSSRPAVNSGSSSQPSGPSTRVSGREPSPSGSARLNRHVDAEDAVVVDPRPAALDHRGQVDDPLAQRLQPLGVLALHQQSAQPPDGGQPVAHRRAGSLAGDRAQVGEGGQPFAVRVVGDRALVDPAHGLDAVETAEERLLLLAGLGPVAHRVDDDARSRPVVVGEVEPGLTVVAAVVALVPPVADLVGDAPTGAGCARRRG